MASNLLGLVLLLTSGLLVLVNGSIVYLNFRFKLRGIERHSSMIALIPQLFAILAALRLNAAAQPWAPVWLPLLVGAVDAGLWRLIWLTVKVMRDRPRAAT